MTKKLIIEYALTLSSLIRFIILIRLVLLSKHIIKLYSMIPTILVTYHMYYSIFVFIFGYI